MLERLWLIPVGFIIGTYGTLIGAGGGFVLVPMLILLYPQESPEVITSISLAVVFFNALSGSLAYMRLKRVDYRSGHLVCRSNHSRSYSWSADHLFHPASALRYLSRRITYWSLLVFDSSILIKIPGGKEVTSKGASNEIFSKLMVQHILSLIPLLSE